MNTEGKLAFLSQFIKSEDLVFDVGASLGNMTQLYLELGARVIAIDPLPSSIATLRERYASQKNVTVVPVALGEEDGKAIMHTCKSHGGVFSTMTDHWVERIKKAILDAEWGQDIEVEVTTLDNLIGIYGLPAFVKIDTEGYEKYVVKGFSHSVPAFCFEYAGDRIEDTTEVIRYCKKMWNNKFNYIGAEEFVFVLQDWVDGDILIPLLSGNKGGWGDIFAKAG